MKYLCSIFLLFVSFTMYGQVKTAYYAALALKDNGKVVSDGFTGQTIFGITITKENVKELAEIFYPFLKEADQELFDSDSVTNNDIAGVITRTLSENPFLQANATALSNDFGRSTSDVSIVGKAISSIGGLDVTNLADGLAKFIVERSKEELNAYFFDRFREEVKRNVELQILFPQTSDLLLAIGIKIYNYNAYLTGLRDAFENDLSALFVNFPELMDHEKHAAAFDKFPNLRLLMKSSFHVVGQLNNDVHPGDVIHQFPRIHGKDSVPENFYNAIRVVDVFSQSVRSKKEGQYWISQDSLSLLGNEVTFRIYLGLVYQTIALRETPLVFDGTLNFNEHVLKPIGKNWDQRKREINEIRTFIYQLGEDAERINTTLKALQNLKGSDEPRYTSIYAFLDASLDFLDHSGEVANLPYLSAHLEALKPQFHTLQQYLGLCRTANELYLNTAERKYGMAVSNVFALLNEAFPSTYQTRWTKEQYILDKTALDEKFPTEADKKEKEYKKAIEALEEQKEEGVHFEYIGLVLKYGSFMAAVVTAETSDEVKEIIEATALPAGSSRIKRESGFNVAVNSYLGVFAGHEWIKDVENKVIFNNFGLSAPIGVSFSWGGLWRSDDSLPGHSFGGFISVIDLGALASFRFQDDSTAIASEIQLGHILAPGVFFSWGIANSPLSLNAGVQMGPLLREVKPEPVLDPIYWRAGLSLVVDIPLYNLYNKEKK